MSESQCGRAQVERSHCRARGPPSVSKVNGVGGVTRLRPPSPRVSLIKVSEVIELVENPNGPVSMSRRFASAEAGEHRIRIFGPFECRHTGNHRRTLASSAER